MADWRENAADQNLRMAQKMLEQQGEVNNLAAEDARLRQRAEKAEDRLNQAQHEVARLVRDGTNHGYLLAGWALVGLEQILGLSLTHANLFGYDDAPSGFVSPATTDERDRLQARLNTATAHVEELRGQRDEARAQLARALKVVQAANEWQLWDAQGALDTALYEWRAGLELSGPPLTAEELRRVVAQLPVSRQKPPADRPSATESQDQGAADAAGTEGSQAQGFAQGAWMGIPLRTDPTVPKDEIRIADSTTGKTLTTLKVAPADPAGLDAAIEAAAHMLFNIGRANNIDWWAGSVADDTRRLFRVKAEAIVRAAAPHLRAAALNEAADEMAGRWPEPWTAQFALWLRERAGREAT